MKVFIDGSAGTTGLRIAQRLAARSDVTLLSIGDEQRKNEAVRAEKMNSADIVFLCLPDDAARQAVTLVTNPHTKIIDASTAHRTQAGWAYGFAELSAAHRAALMASKRTAVPGCHASGFIALVYPLVAAGILPKDALLCAYSATGYSGGGKSMIAEYESAARPAEYNAPRQYGTAQLHKHLPEMAQITQLINAPIFMPVVGDYYAGMLVTVPLFAKQLAEHYSVKSLRDVYHDYYHGQPLISVLPQMDAFLPAGTLAGKDSMEIMVGGNEERFLLCARFDNLGKGASGAAIQCMNIMSGIAETTGLVL